MAMATVGQKQMVTAMIDSLFILVQRELCNEIDDNCNGLVDEGFGDADEDGIPNCLDTEECDGLDNNGNGTIDEGFTDTDGDGITDCLDTEECDGFDNDGDGVVDEGYDQDGGYIQLVRHLKRL